MTRASLRRDLERWAENLVNASVDFARIVLASSGGRIPETYREAVRDLSIVPGFPRDDVAHAAREWLASQPGLQPGEWSPFRPPRTRSPSSVPRRRLRP